MAITTFPDPFITCCFISDDTLFINLFYTHTLRHYHFFYNFDLDIILGQVVAITIGTNKKNFPYKCFYNDDDDEVYSFYRQG